MIKDKYLGQVITITQGTNKRVVEVFEGMPICDVKFLKDHGIDVMKPTKVDKTRKKENYKGIKEDGEE